MAGIIAQKIIAGNVQHEGASILQPNTVSPSSTVNHILTDRCYQNPPVADSLSKKGHMRNSWNHDLYGE